MRIHHWQLPAVVICLGITIQFVVPKLGAQVTSQQKAGGINPYKQLDDAARLIKSNTDQPSIRGLADAIFSFPRALPPVPDPIANVIKERLVRAEINFRSGAQEGVMESDIAGLINSTADRLGLPSYAKTSAQQVRVLRMQLALSSPAFMGPGVIEPNMKIGDSISQRLSPLQAVHLLNSLIDQKIINPDYQVEPAEWERTHLPASLARIQQQQQMAQARSPGNQPKRTEIRTVRRKRDLQDAIVRVSSSLGFADSMNLIDEAFAALKIGH